MLKDLRTKNVLQNANPYSVNTVYAIMYVGR